MDEVLEGLRRACDEDPLDITLLERWQRERERQGWRHRGRTVDEWVAELDGRRRDAAALQLVTIGIGAAPALCRCLTSDPPGAAISALNVLDHIGFGERERVRRLALPFCLRALANDPEEPLRTKLARMVAGNGAAALPGVRKLAEDRPLPALTVVRLLGIHAAPMRAFIEEALEHDDEAYVLSAAMSLATIGPGPAAEDRLRALLQHPNYFIQLHAVEALGKLQHRHPATDQALLALLDTDYAELWSSLALALARRGEPEESYAAAIAEAAEPWGPSIQAACIAALLALEERPDPGRLTARYGRLRQGNDQLRPLVRYLRELGLTRGNDHPLVRLLEQDLEACSDAIDRGLIQQALTILAGEPSS